MVSGWMWCLLGPHLALSRFRWRDPTPALTLTLNQVLLDWELGSMSGLDVLKHIQQRKEAALSTKSNPLYCARPSLTCGLFAVAVVP